MDTRTDNSVREAANGQTGLLGLDIETTGLNPRNDELVVLGLATEYKTLITDLRDMSPESIRTILEEWFRNRVVIGHNLSFDLQFLREKTGVDYPTSLWDTMLAERLLTAGLLEEEVNLKYVAEKYLGMKMDKTLTTTFTEDGELTPEQVDYLSKDVEAPLQIAKLQKPLLEKHKLGKVWALERAVLPIFAEMIRRGVMLDIDYLNTLLDEYREKHKILTKELQDTMTPLVEWKKIEKRDEMQADLDRWMSLLDAETEALEYQWDFAMYSEPEAIIREVWEKNKWDDETIDKKDNSPKGRKRFVKAQLKAWREANPRPPAPKLDTGLINLNSPFQPKDAFLELGLELDNLRGQTLIMAIPDASDEVKTLLRQFHEWKKANKILSSFGDSMIALCDDEGALHGDFKQIGTDTGRPSCSKPNMLQMPSKKTDPRFRSAFVPRDGYLFVVADYSQIELRIMAQLSGDKAMTKAFNDGLDLHTYTASLMFNVPFDDVTELQRKTAKTINFGILYGMGPKKLRATLAEQHIDVTMEEAQDAVTRWKRSYRQAAEKIEEWQMFVMKQGYTETPLGRKRFFNLDTKDRFEQYAIQRAGANHCIQGTSADITKMAMVLIHDMLEGTGTIVLQIYDEIVVEVPEGYAFWAKEVVEIAMNEAAKEVLTTVPVAVDAVVSRSWNEDDSIRT